MTSYGLELVAAAQVGEQQDYSSVGRTTGGDCGLGGVAMGAGHVGKGWEVHPSHVKVQMSWHN